MFLCMLVIIGYLYICFGNKLRRSQGYGNHSCLTASVYVCLHWKDIWNLVSDSTVAIQRKHSWRKLELTDRRENIILGEQWYSVKEWNRFLRNRKIGFRELHFLPLKHAVGSQLGERIDSQQTRTRNRISSLGEYSIESCGESQCPLLTDEFENSQANDLSNEFRWSLVDLNFSGKETFNYLGKLSGKVSREFSWYVDGEAPESLRHAPRFQQLCSNGACTHGVLVIRSKFGQSPPTAAGDLKKHLICTTIRFSATMRDLVVI